MSHRLVAQGVGVGGVDKLRLAHQGRFAQIGLQQDAAGTDAEAADITPGDREPRETEKAPAEEPVKNISQIHLARNLLFNLLRLGNHKADLSVRFLGQHTRSPGI